MIRLIHRPVRYFIIHLRKHLTDRQFLILASSLVGLTAGLAATVMKSLVFLIQEAVLNNLDGKLFNYLYIFFPLAGIMLTIFLVKRFWKEDFQKGYDKIIYAIAKKSSILPPSQMYSHIITSGITVGSGGSVGLESPIVSTGSAIGSNFARSYFLGYKERTLLLGSGVAAGIAAAFNAPFAGVLFALEVLLVDVSIAAMIPLIVAAAAGALLSNILLKEGILLSFPRHLFNSVNTPFYVMLGILCGMVSIYYARAFHYVEKKLLAFKSLWKRGLIAGICLALLILFFPSLFSEGYESIKMLAARNPRKVFEGSVLSGLLKPMWAVWLAIAGAMMLKVIAAACTVAGGGNGGNFAPSLFVGAYLGFAFSVLLQAIGLEEIPVSNFTIVAMAGLLSGVLYAPLTAIFLIAEITGGYDLMIPLMIVSAVSYSMAKYFEPLSMEGSKLSEVSHVHTHDRDVYVLSKLELSSLLETHFTILAPNTTLGELVKQIERSVSSIYPVVDNEKKLHGIVYISNIRDVLFKKEMYETVQVRELMRKSPATLSESEDLYEIMHKFDKTEAEYLPMIREGKYAGLISRTRILSHYRYEILKTL